MTRRTGEGACVKLPEERRQLNPRSLANRRPTRLLPVPGKITGTMPEPAGWLARVYRPGRRGPELSLLAC
jgi:hypothetical protein